jgi:hypothetical protein
MLLSLIYFAVRRLLRLVTASGDRDDVARDVELLVLRHQLRVLSRSRRLQLKRRDRILFAAASELLPHKMWRSLPVSPQTVLRWLKGAKTLIYLSKAASATLRSPNPWTGSADAAVASLLRSLPDSASANWRRQPR